MYEEHTERKLFELLGGEIIQKKKYKLTQFLGVFSEEMMIVPYIYQDKVEKDDCYLICSDGLTDMVDKKQIKEILESRQDSETIVKKLLSAAKEAGGKDNITMICLKI